MFSLVRRVGRIAFPKTSENFPAPEWSLTWGPHFSFRTLTGNVFETRALSELIPDWKEKGAPVDMEVTDDSFMFLTESNSVRIPNLFLPPQLVRLCDD